MTYIHIIGFIVMIGGLALLVLGLMMMGGK